MINCRTAEFFRTWAEHMEEFEHGHDHRVTKRVRIDRLTELLMLMYRLGARDAADVLETAAAIGASDQAMNELEQLWKETYGGPQKPESRFLPPGTT
jgi:hypothetical protein